MILARRRRFPCPCCAHLTLTERPPGSHQICPVCFWEDDPVQHDDPTFSGGANTVSLEAARRNFSAHGWSEARFSTAVRRPLPDERP